MGDHDWYVALAMEEYWTVAQISKLPALVILDREYLEGRHTGIDAYACMVLSNSARIFCIAKQLVPTMLQDVWSVVCEAREIGDISQAHANTISGRRPSLHEESYQESSALAPPDSVEEIVANLHDMSTKDFDLHIQRNVCYRIAKFCETLWSQAREQHTELNDAYNSFSEAEHDELVKMSSGALEPDFAKRVQDLSRQGWRIRDAVEALDDIMVESIEDLNGCVKAQKLRKMLRLSLKDRMAKYE